MAVNTSNMQEKRLVTYQTVDLLIPSVVMHLHLLASATRYATVEVKLVPSGMEAEAQEEEGNNPSSMDLGIEPFLNADQMAENLSSTKHVVRSCMHEVEHEEVSYHVPGGKPEVALAVIFEVYVHLRLPNVPEHDFDQVYEPMD